MRLIILLCGLLLPTLASAQRLLWETTIARPNPVSNEGLGTMLVQSNRILMIGSYGPPRTTGCQPTAQSYSRIYNLNGILIREQLGRGLQNGEGQINPATGSGGWWTGRGYGCVAGSNTALQHPYVQRLTVTGDTLAGWWLAPTTPRATVNASLVRGRHLLTAGMVNPIGQTGQGQQVTLTCSDTLGTVRWSQAYPRQPSAFDYAIALAPTPRGGYLISGDAYVNFAYQHYLVETDSLGNLRRQLTLTPLGPAMRDGTRYTWLCNILTLPNAQGYLLSGTADSVVAGQTPPNKEIGYVMRLDTALNIVWVYRHPPALSGTGATQNHAYRIRYLPNNTVGLLLTEVRNTGTPDAFLVQLNVATGRRIGSVYQLSSNTETWVVPYDWHWVGDGTLVLGGKSFRTGVTYTHGYLARWDFRATPLAARSAAEARASATFYAFPNPASGPVAFHWQLPPDQRAGAVRLYSVLGQLLQTVPLPALAEGQQEVAGLATGLYVARLVDADGRGQGSAVRLVVE